MGEITGFMPSIIYCRRYSDVQKNPKHTYHNILQIFISADVFFKRCQIRRYASTTSFCFEKMMSFQDFPSALPIKNYPQFLFKSSPSNRQVCGTVKERQRSLDDNEIWYGMKAWGSVENAGERDREGRL